MPPFLAMRHVSRLHQGNYGANRSKRPVPLVRSHISRRDTFDISAACELETFDEPHVTRFYEPAAGETSRSAARNFVGGGLIKRPAQDRHTPQSTFLPGKTTNKLEVKTTAMIVTRPLNKRAYHTPRYCCSRIIVVENYPCEYP